jgi:hypothetical protein
MLDAEWLAEETLDARVPTPLHGIGIGIRGQATRSV